MRVGVGSLIWVDTDEPQPDGAMEVVAVFEDFPDNSLLGECEVVKNLGETNLYTTSEWSFNYFVKFRPGADPDEFARQWTNVNQRCSARRPRNVRRPGTPQMTTTIGYLRRAPFSGIGTLFRVGFTGTLPAGVCRHDLYPAGYCRVGYRAGFHQLRQLFLRTGAGAHPYRQYVQGFRAPASSLRFNFVFEGSGSS